MKGGGVWTSYCPICGIHFYINFEELILKNLVKYHSSSKAKNKRIWEKNKDKIINNFSKFKKIEKYTFSNYNNITLLLPNSVVKHNIKYIDKLQFSSKSKYYNEIYFDYPLYDDKGTKGLPMHTECWNLAKKNLKHQLKFEDFLFNKYNKILDYDNYLFKSINYGPPLNYVAQDWSNNLYVEDSNAFLLNEKHWYSLYLPSGKSLEAKKNSKRIEKILEKFIKGIKKPKENKKPKAVIKKLNKNRPSPSESATKFKEGIKKKGNDGNMYIIAVNKNGIKRWKKIL